MPTFSVRSTSVAGLTLAALTGLAGCGTTTTELRLAAHRDSAAVPAQPPASFTVAATGDFLLHEPLVEQGAADARGHGYDFTPMLAQLRPVIGGADLGICHMETPLASPGGPFSGYPAFNSPPQIAAAARRLGYDTCSTASNHTIDKGAAGVRRTLATLDRAGLRHTGSARSPQEARRLNIMNVRGVKVAQLSHTYGTNGIPVPAGRPWLVNTGLRASRILAQAARARAAGAEVVIVSLHWGVEYRHAPTAGQRALARRLLASPDIDLIVGHHAHVVQPFERINGKWVAYGVGNQVANPYANSPRTHEGIVARFRFTKEAGHWQAAPSFVPTLVTGGPIRLVDLTAAADRPARHRLAVRTTTRIVRSLGHRVPLG